MRILIGDISSYKAIASARFIRLNYPDVVLIGFDSRKFARLCHTKYVEDCIICDEEDIEKYLEIIQDHNIDVFIPVINKSLAKFWSRKEEFGSCLDYLGEFEDYDLLNDKSRLHELALSMGIKVPQKYGLKDEMKFPIVVKPTNLSSAKGVVYIENEKQWREFNVPENSIIQEYVEGEGVGYSFYAKNGKICDAYGHRRLAEYPVSGGSSTYRTGYEDDRMREVAQKIIGHLSYSGFAMFEFKLTKSHELYLLEVNPRIWGSINQGMANGTDYFESILGKESNLQKNRDNNINTYLSPHIYVTLLMYLLKGNVQPLTNFLKNINRNKSDVAMFRDPLGYVSTLLRKVT